MNISVASDTVMAIAPGQCRDQNDNIDIQVPNVQYLNSAVNGANGLDTGSLAASSNYLIWEIADSTGKLLPAGLISLQSNVGPLVPYGYDSMRLIGAVQTDGAAHFLAASVRNANYYKGFYLQPAVGVLSGGNATTFTAINLGTAIPTTTDTFVIALCTVTFIPAAANDIVQFRPTGSSSTANLPVITGVAAGVAQTQNIALNCGVGGGNPEVDYRVSVGGDSVSMSVYGYYVTLS
jgi:hypothetical protein